MSELYDALRDSQAAAMALRTQIKTWQNELDQLEVETRGLEGAIARREGSTPMEPSAELAETGAEHSGLWPTMRRAEAIVAMLELHPRGAGPQELARAFREVGRSDTPQMISNALTNLKHQGRVESRGVARWLLVQHAAVGNYPVTGEIELMTVSPRQGDERPNDEFAHS